jgi:glycine C-acetyltransferase
MYEGRLFRQNLAPPIVAATLTALDKVEQGGELRKQLWDNVARFRDGMTKAGFRLAGADHPIIPIMLGDARLAGKFADRLLEEGIYVTGFSFPVVPKEQARIRTQMSAAHTTEQIDSAIEAFTRIGRELEVIS